MTVVAPRVLEIVDKRIKNMIQALLKANCHSQIREMMECIYVAAWQDSFITHFGLVEPDPELEEIKKNLLAVWEDFKLLKQKQTIAPIHSIGRRRNNGVKNVGPKDNGDKPSDMG